MKNKNIMSWCIVFVILLSLVSIYFLYWVFTNYELDFIEKGAVIITFLLYKYFLLFYVLSNIKKKIKWRIENEGS